MILIVNEAPLRLSPPPFLSPHVSIRKLGLLFVLGSLDVNVLGFIGLLERAQAVAVGAGTRVVFLHGVAREQTH